MRYFFFMVIVCVLLVACSSGAETSRTLDGKALFMSKCILCHGADGRMGLNGAMSLPDSKLTLEQRMGVVRNGRKIMPAFNSILSSQEIEAVAQYTLTLK